MRLLDPDVGEVLDRLSILELKIQAGINKGVSTQQWDEEKDALEKYLQKRVQVFQRGATAKSTEDFNELNTSLGKVNEQLWRCEDEIRALIKEEQHISPATTDEIARVAVHIVELNDLRSDLVRRINAIFGVLTQEKIYVQ